MLVILFCGLPVGAVADDKGDADKDVKEPQGVWTFESQVVDGKETPADRVKTMTSTIEGGKYAVRRGDELVQAGTYIVDPSKSPKAIDMTVGEGPGKGTVMLGIYAFDGGMLKVCFDPTGKKRPTEFKSEAGSGLVLSSHKRAKG
jgi:uncharacterized protein (TIGR03067 family)